MKYTKSEEQAIADYFEKVLAQNDSFIDFVDKKVKGKWDKKQVKMSIRELLIWSINTLHNK